MKSSAYRFVLACALALGCAWLSGLAGSGFQSSATAQERPSTEFVAMEGPNREEISGGGLMLGAYGVVMVLLIGYVVRLAQLQSGTSREVDRLERALARAADTTKDG